MKENEIGLPDELVMNKIYLVRGHKVMIDSDLADLYQVETKALNQAVTRNEYRFPEDFMFQLSENEWANLKSQFVTSSWGGRRKLPYVFTEHGVIMLSSVLNSKRAIQVNIQIMRIFTKIRQMLFDNTELRLAIEDLRNQTEDNSKNIDLIFQHLDKFLEKHREPVPMKKIGYEIPEKI
ncbi:MAG: ORF6N domain-containing protein [Bacteroidia bacterium]|nr:ORF6N domain-containing protein [Bacteroidia bacterium]